MAPVMPLPELALPLPMAPVMPLPELALPLPMAPVMPLPELALPLPMAPVMPLPVLPAIPLPVAPVVPEIAQVTPPPPIFNPGGVLLGGPQSPQSFVNADASQAREMHGIKKRVLAPAKAQYPNEARGDAGANDSDMVCVSLRALCETARSGSLAIRSDPALDTCYGLNFILGYVIDHANRDIVLYGTNRQSRPAIQFDDLCVCELNVWNPERLRYVKEQFPCPFCSLDPRSGAMGAVDLVLENSRGLNLREVANRNLLIQKLTDALGPQQVRIGGISRDVRLAHVMIDADYHMKKVSQGHATVPGVLSVSRPRNEGQRTSNGIRDSLRKILGSGSQRNRSSMSRFWFHLDENHPRFLVADGIVNMNECAMIILTERQISAADGTLQDGGGEDPNALAFAAELSTQLRRGKTRVKEYEDLENLYRLFATLKAIQFREDDKLIALNLNAMLNHQPRCFEMPPALPALANVEVNVEEANNEVRVSSSMVCGGASMDVKLSAENFHRTSDRNLADTAQLILRSRRDRRASSWKPQHKP
jgi:hypothetical protein